MKQLSALKLVFALAAVASVCQAQEKYKHVGVPPTGHVAFEYIGVVRQNGTEFETYGYFTYIRDVSEELSFFDPKKRDETTARFTFHSKSKMASRSIVKKVFSISATGDMDIFVRNHPLADASIDRGADFTDGTKIAKLKFRGQSVVAVTAPNVGINSAVLEARQVNEDWRGFRWNDTDFAFGRPNTRFRFTHLGSGELAQKEPPVASIAIAGRALSVASEEK